MNNSDDISLLFRKAFDILFLNSPISAAYGLISGVVIQGFIYALAPFFSILESIRSSEVSTFHYMAFGVMIFTGKDYFRRDELSPSVQRALLIIDQSVEKGAISKLEARQQYRNVISSVVEEARVTKKSSMEAER